MVDEFQYTKVNKMDKVYTLITILDNEDKIVIKQNQTKENLQNYFKNTLSLFAEDMLVVKYLTEKNVVDYYNPEYIKVSNYFVNDYKLDLIN